MYRASLSRRNLQRSFLLIEHAHRMQTRDTYFGLRMAWERPFE
jgi:hypothetical protein